MTKHRSLPDWASRALAFLESLEDKATGGARSTPDGPVTLYGSGFAALARYYIDPGFRLDRKTAAFIAACQSPDSGLFIGPEMRDHFPPEEIGHNREHLLLHLTCATIPVCQQFGIDIAHPIYDARRFCDRAYLTDWLSRRNLKGAWLEGNNLLYVGHLLVHLRDVEKYPGAAEALQLWFDWLDKHVDPATNLWGTNGYCSVKAAVYGAYHQFLIYYYEDHPFINPKGLVDAVLSLQHTDGGFDPAGNGGACEDVDAVDILVHMYKRFPYRRAEIRNALRRCARHMLSTQNSDGGFPYRRFAPQSHMGVPGTQAAANVSTTFPTWFRIHALALCAEIIPDEPAFKGLSFRFNSAISVGWHASPAGWRLEISKAQQRQEALLAVMSLGERLARRAVRKGIKLAKKASGRG
jgi:hypothetical protein